MVRTCCRLVVFLSVHAQVELRSVLLLLCRFGIGFSNGAAVGGGSTDSPPTVLVCDPFDAANPVALYTIVASSSPGSASSLVRASSTQLSNVHYSVSNGQAVMTWTQSVNASDASSPQVSSTSEGLGNIVYVLGSASASVAESALSGQSFASGIINSVAAPTSSACSGIALDDNMAISWTVQGSLVSFSARLVGQQAWYVTQAVVTRTCFAFHSIALTLFLLCREG